jgi:hypothetical protein
VIGAPEISTDGLRFYQHAVAFGSGAMRMSYKRPTAYAHLGIFSLRRNDFNIDRTNLAPAAFVGLMLFESRDGRHQLRLALDSTFASAGEGMFRRGSWLIGVARNRVESWYSLNLVEIFRV